MPNWWDQDAVLAGQIASGACTPSPDPNSQGFCLMADGSEQPCTLIRECTPDRHFEYRIPGANPNVNINVWDPASPTGFSWSGPLPAPVGAPQITVNQAGEYAPTINYDSFFVPFGIVPVQTRQGGPGNAAVSPTYAASRASEASGGSSARGAGRVGTRGNGANPMESLTANSGYVSANMLSPTSMAARLMALIGNDQGTPDEWCFVYNESTGLTCPAPEDMGFVGASRSARLTAQAWLDALRNFEQAVYTGPGFGTNGTAISGSYGDPVFGTNGPVLGGGGSSAPLRSGAGGGMDLMPLLIVGLLVFVAVRA